MPVDLYIPPGGVSVDPVSPFAGDNVTISAPVFNAGPGDAKSVDVYFTLNDTINHTLPPISARCMLTDLKSSTSQKATAVWVTKGLSPGAYDVLVFVHPIWTVDWVPPDTNLSNNNASFMVTLAKPDVSLRLDAFRIDPAGPRLGDAMNVTVTLTNTASRTVVDVPVALFIDQELVVQQTLELVNGSPGTLKTALPTSGYSEGGHSLRLQAVNIDETLNFTLIVMRPDLALLNLTLLPVLPQAGDVLSATVKVANIGEIASLQCNLGLFADNATVPAAVMPVPAIPPGDAVYRTLQWNTTGLSPGTHVVHVLVDPESAVEESNRSNNELIQKIDVTGVVDLSIGEPVISPAAPRQGDSVGFSFLVRNLGTMRCNFANLTLKVGGRIVDSIELADISAGAVFNSSLAWATAGYPPENYSYLASVAVGLGQGDSIPANDAVHGQLRLLPSLPLPDLVIPDIVMTEQTLHAGERLFLGVTVENAGNRDSNASLLAVTAESGGGRIFPMTGAPVPVPALAVGQSVVVNVTGDTSALPPGFYEINATVDPANALVESNETNNHLFRDLAVLEPLPPAPELAVGNITIDGKLEDGQKVTIHADISNTGSADAVNVQVSFFLDGKRIGTRTIDVIASNGTGACALDWVAAPGTHTLNVSVTADGASEASGQLPVSVSGAAGAGAWSAGAVGLVVALVLMLGAAVALMSRRPGNFGPSDRPPAEEE